MIRLFIIGLMCLPSFLKSQTNYPQPVLEVLKIAGRNKPELTKALDYFYKKGDAKKIKAIEFLITNMDIHYSSNYFWADTTGKRIPFNELDYTTYEAALIAFDVIKKQNIGVHPQAYI